MATSSGLKGGEEVGRSVCFVWLVVSGSNSHQLEKLLSIHAIDKRLAGQQDYSFGTHVACKVSPRTRGMKSCWIRDITKASS